MISKIDRYSVSYSSKISNNRQASSKNITSKFNNEHVPSFSGVYSEFGTQAGAFFTALLLLEPVRALYKKAIKDRATKKYVQALLYTGKQSEEFSLVVENARSIVTDLNSLAKTKQYDKDKKLQKFASRIQSVFKKKAGVEIKPHFNTNPHASTEGIQSSLDVIEAGLAEIFLQGKKQMGKEEYSAVGSHLREVIKETSEYLAKKYPVKQVQPNKNMGKILKMSQWRKKLAKEAAREIPDEAA